MKVIGRRRAATWAVVERGHVGADFLCQMQERVDASAKLLRAMLAIGDCAVERKNRKWIWQQDEIFERDAALFQRHSAGTEEAGAGGDGFCVGVGERRAA